MLSIIVNSTFDKIVMKDFPQGLFETKKKLKNFENKIANLLFDAGLKIRTRISFQRSFSFDRFTRRSFRRIKNAQ